MKLQALRRACVWTFVFGVLASSSVNGQIRIECVTPPTCEATATGGVVVPLRARVLDAANNPVSGVDVVVTVPGAPAPDTLRSSANGNVFVSVLMNIPPAGARVTMRAVQSAAAAHTEFRIRRPPPPTTPRLTAVGGNKQVWRAELVLKKPLVVHLESITTSTQCGGRVAFKPISGGSAFPDTVPATWDGARCVAAARWVLGKHMGAHRLHASLVGASSTVQFEANARAESRIATGVAMTVTVAPFDRFSRSADTTVVVTTTTDASGTITSRTRREVSAADTVVTTDREWAVVEPIVGVDVPLFHTDRLRMFMGVSVTNPTRSWYIGLDWSQFIAGGFEATGFGAFVGARVLRRQVGTTEKCREGVAFCQTDAWRVEGPTLWLSVDAGKAFGALTKAFGA